jgi:hypothetical protein
VACCAERVWKAAVKIASTESVGVVSAFAPPQALRVSIRIAASGINMRFNLKFFIFMVNISIVTGGKKLPAQGQYIIG